MTFLVTFSLFFVFYISSPQFLKMDYQPKLRRSKRLAIKNRDQRSKRPKLIGDEENAATQITDVNDDCLEEIFKRLNLKSLLNISNSNKFLVHAARSVYRRRYSKYLVMMYPHPQQYPENVRQFEYGINVYGLETCLQFLRCFGPSITDLEVFCSMMSNKQCAIIDRYINNYCAERLTSLSYHLKLRFSFQEFQNQFIKLETVKIHNFNTSVSNNQLRFFVRSFPNLRHLELKGIRFNRRSVGASFPQLTYLKISITFEDIEPEKLGYWLQLNPQLENLDIIWRGIRMQLATM